MSSSLAILLLFVGALQIVHADEKKLPVTKAVLIGASPNLYGLVRHLKEDLIANCKANGNDMTKDLEAEYGNLLTCINKKTLYVDSRAEYLLNFEECTKGPIKKVKTCLKKEQAYYPDVLLKLAKIQVNFICDKHEIITKYLTPCLQVFEKPAVSASYKKCFVDSLGQNNTLAIPNSVDLFCQRYMASLKCFPEVLKKECPEYPQLKQYSQDYSFAMSAPCNKNVTKSIFV